MSQVIILAQSHSGAEKVEKIVADMGLQKRDLSQLIAEIKQFIMTGQVQSMASVEKTFGKRIQKEMKGDFYVEDRELNDLSSLFAKFIKNPRYIVVFRNFLDVALEADPKNPESIMSEFRKSYGEQEMLKLFVENNFRNMLLTTYERMKENPDKTKEDIKTLLE